MPRQAKLPVLETPAPAFQIVAADPSSFLPDMPPATMQLINHLAQQGAACIVVDQWDSATINRTVRQVKQAGSVYGGRTVRVKAGTSNGANARLFTLHTPRAKAAASE